MTTLRAVPDGFPPPPPPAPAKSSDAKAWLGLAGCAAAIAGSVMPWISITSGFGAADVKGTDGDGKLTALLAVIALLLAVFGMSKDNRANIRGAGGVCILGTIFSVYEWQHISSKINGVSTEFLRASVGNGIWVMLAGFVVGAICLFKAAPDPLDDHVNPVPPPVRPPTEI